MSRHLLPRRPDNTTEAGLPWFEYCASDLKALAGAKKLAGLDSVAAQKHKKGEGALIDNDPVAPTQVKKIKAKKSVVREGDF